MGPPALPQVHPGGTTAPTGGSVPRHAAASSEGMPSTGPPPEQVDWRSSVMGSRGYRASMPRVRRDRDLARLDHRLQVRQKTRPAAGHGGDERGAGAVDLVRDGELHRAIHGLELDGAAARAFGLELGLPAVLPAEIGR